MTGASSSTSSAGAIDASVVVAPFTLSVSLGSSSACATFGSNAAAAVSASVRRLSTDATLIHSPILLLASVCQHRSSNSNRRALRTQTGYAYCSGSSLYSRRVHAALVRRTTSDPLRRQRTGNNLLRPHGQQLCEIDHMNKRPIHRSIRSAHIRGLAAAAPHQTSAPGLRGECASYLVG